MNFLIIALLGIGAYFALNIFKKSGSVSSGAPGDVYPEGYNSGAPGDVYPTGYVQASSFVGPNVPQKTDWSVDEIQTLIKEIAGEEHYSRPNVALGIGNQESSFRADVYNPEITAKRGNQPDSIGVMGIQLATGQAMLGNISEEDLYNPIINIRAGIKYLKYLENKWFSKYGIDGVIQMYNLGETRFLNGARATSYLAGVKAYAGLA